MKRKRIQFSNVINRLFWLVLVNRLCWRFSNQSDFILWKQRGSLLFEWLFSFWFTFPYGFFLQLCSKSGNLIGHMRQSQIIANHMHSSQWRKTEGRLWSTMGSSKNFPKRKTFFIIFELCILQYTSAWNYRMRVNSWELRSTQSCSLNSYDLWIPPRC